MKIELDLTPEQAEKVKKMLAEEKKKWINNKDKFYFLKSTTTDDFIWTDSSICEDIIKRSNIYRTKEAVEQADRQRLALGAIHQYVRENGVRMAGFNGYVPDWKNGEEEKWQISGWDYRFGRPISELLGIWDRATIGLIFPTAEERQKVLDNCKKELEDLLKVDYSIIR